jgi:chemotaxis protein MotB
MGKLMLVLGMAAVVGCGGISKEKYGAKEAEAETYKKEVTALESKAQSLEQENASLQAQVNKAKSELESTTAKLAEQNAEYARLKGQTKKLSEPVIFRENSSKLTPEAKRSLDAAADAIRQLKDMAVIVGGFTDNAEGGKNAYVKRWQLSSARALAVAKHLAGRGLDPARIGVAAFGEARPVAPNDTLANRTLNRRAEIALTPSQVEMGTLEVSPATVEDKKP